MTLKIPDVIIIIPKCLVLHIKQFLHVAFKLPLITGPLKVQWCKIFPSNSFKTPFMSGMGY